jgi:hypothetical protein
LRNRRIDDLIPYSHGYLNTDLMGINISVVKACEFMADTVETGTLAGNDAVSPTQLSSKNSGGAAGGVTIKCNTEAKVSTKDYEVTGNKFDIAQATYTVSTDKQKESSAISVGIGQTPIKVNLTLDSKSAIPAGDYAYNVLISAVAGN